MGGDFEAETEHKDEIVAARKESTQLSRMGELKGALKTLQAVEPWLCDGMVKHCPPPPPPPPPPPSSSESPSPSPSTT